MAVVTKHYFLPEDKSEFEVDNKAGAMLSALWDMQQWFRETSKHNPLELNKEQLHMLDMIKDQFHTTLNDNDINLYELGE